MNGGVVIYQILSNDANLQPLIGDRIYPLLYNNDYEVPFIYYEKTSVEYAHTKTGNSTLDGIRYTVGIVANTSNEANEIAQYVESALSYASGTYDGVTLQQAYIEDEREVWNELAKNDGVCVLSQSYNLMIQK